MAVRSFPSYPQRHSGTLVVLGSAPGGLDEFRRVKSSRSDLAVMTVNHAAGAVAADFLVSDHYEIIAELRELQDALNHKYTTHCTWDCNTAKWPEVDYWWEWPRSDASSAQTAIRVGLAVGFDEVILCGCPLSSNRPLYLGTSGRGCVPIRATWPPPRDIQIHQSKESWNTSEEILERFRENFARHAEAWKDRVFSMSGFTSEILGPPRFLK